MRALITGSFGFIGRNLLVELVPQDEVVPYDIEFGKDILDLHELYRTFSDVDIIYHLAAETGVPRSWHDPTVFYETNVVGSANVFKVARELGKKVIYASTGEVLVGNSPYAASKIGAEAAMDTELLKGADIVALRILNPYGEAQPDNYIIPRFIKMASNGEDITIHGTGDQRKDYIHVLDIVKAFVKAKELISGTKANLGSGETKSIKEIAEEIIKQTKSDSKLKFIPSPRLGEQQNMNPPIDHLTAIGWKPMISFTKGLERMIRYYGKPIQDKTKYN